MIPNLNIKINNLLIGCSLHGISGTRWSDRVESVKPFVAHLPGVKLALEALLELNLTPKTRNEIKGAVCYVSSFTCIIMSVVWHRILVPIDFCNKVIEASDTTLDMEVANIKSLLPNWWLSETVGKQCGMKPSLLHPACR